MTLVEHHIKYKEIHGEDKTIWMEYGDHKRLHSLLRQNGKCTIPAEILNKITILAHQRAKKARIKQYNSIQGKIKVFLNRIIYKLQCVCYWMYIQTYIPIPSYGKQAGLEDEYILPDAEYLYLDKECGRTNENNDTCSEVLQKPEQVIYERSVEGIRNRVFETIQNNPNITNAEICIKMGISDRTLSRRIAELKKRGVL